MQQGETEKHGKIMAAAAALFASQGYKKTTVDEIVDGAGISKGLFYHYFSNKRELYLHLYDAYVDLMSRSIRERVDVAEPDFFRRLRQIAHIRIDFISEHPHLWGFLYSAYYEGHPDVAPLIRGKNEALLRDSYAGSAANIDWSKLRKGLPPDAALEMVTWVAEGFVRKVAGQVPNAQRELYEQFDEYLDCLRTGLYGREGE